MADSSENPLVPKQEDENDPHFEPVIKLTEQVEIKTNEEDETAIFKMRAKLFRFENTSQEWKERGTGEVRLLQHKQTQKVRLVMRRDKTLKVCANHLISASMKLQPNIGSDRSWVWKVLADYSEDPPTSETLAIRFANTENATQFKTAFEEAQQTNVKLTAASAPSAPAPSDPPALEAKSAEGDEAKEEVEEEVEEEVKEEAKEEPAADAVEGSAEEKKGDA